MFNLLLSNTAMGVVIITVIAALGSTQRSAISILFEEPERGWRWMAWVWVSILAALIAWITFTDDWLQLATEPYRLSQQWDSHRVIFDPVDRTIRLATIGLIALSLLPSAALFARHIGGYVLQTALLVMSLCAWFPVFIFRQRLDMFVNTAPENTPDSLTETASFLSFWLLRSMLGVLSVTTTWLVLVMAIAPVVTFVLDRLNWRAPKISPEANSFYAALEANAAQHADVSLASRWKPIRPRA
jgi:MFS family permease